MYKKQMRVQRILCILSVIASALIFVYSLGIMTDVHDMLYNFLENDSVDTSLYTDMQDERVFELRGERYGAAVYAGESGVQSIQPVTGKITALLDRTPGLATSRVYTAADPEGAPILLFVDAARQDADLTALPGVDPESVRECDAVWEDVKYVDVYGFVHQFELVGIGLILISCTLFITNTHIRRRYYVSNFISTLLVFGATCAASVWAVLNILPLRERFLNLDFDQLQTLLEAKKAGDYFTTSPFWFDLSWAALGFAVLVSVLLIVNAVWKIRLMARERDLLDSGKAVLS